MIVLSAERLLSLKSAFRVFRNLFQSDKHMSIFLSFKIALSRLKVATWSCLSIVERFYSNLVIFSFFSKSFTKRIFRSVAFLNFLFLLLRKHVWEELLLFLMFPFVVFVICFWTQCYTLRHKSSVS